LDRFYYCSATSEPLYMNRGNIIRYFFTHMVIDTIICRQ